MQSYHTVVGVNFRGAEAKEIVGALTESDGDKLHLLREPENPHDRNAVAVLFNETSDLINDQTVHIGYLARDNNFGIAEGLDTGHSYTIKVVGFETRFKPVLLLERSDDARG